MFECGKRSEGTMRYANGDTYIGVFDLEGFKTNGNIIYANGDEFAGDFEQGSNIESESDICISLICHNIRSRDLLI